MTSVTPAVASAATGAAATDSAFLQQETGYSASQLESKSVCGKPTPGTMSCLAQVLSVKRTGEPATLRHHPQAAPETVLRTHARSYSLESPAVVSPSAIVSSSTAPANLTPEFLQWAYDLSALSASGGTADTVAVVDAYNDPNAGSDLAAFRSAFDLPACALGSCFRVYNQTGGEIDAGATAPGLDTTDKGEWQTEESLDVQAVSALCPNCRIILVEAASTTDANLMQAAAEAKALGANQISMSFGGRTQTEPGTATGAWSFSATASLAASGDNGYNGDGYVSYPAAQADVTAIGGTTLVAANNARGFQETVWNTDSSDTTSSGCDTSQIVPSYENAIKSSDACGGRAYDDISADANPNSGLDVYDSYGQNGTTTTPWIIVGGTSLATPLTAAYEAIAGIDAAGGLAQVAPDPTTKTLWPAWAYTYAAELNDVISTNDNTSNYSCATVICNAQSGWDGPSGNGSISGAIVTGSPQIGGTYATYTSSNAAGTETLNGGIYPNGSSITYQWEYGPSTAYGSVFPLMPVSAAGSSTLQTVSTTIPSLSGSYHYRLDVTFASGGSSCTIYGYDNTFTAGTTATNVDNAYPSGTAPRGSTPTGNAGACNSLIDTASGSAVGNGSSGTGTTAAPTTTPTTTATTPTASGETSNSSPGASAPTEIEQPSETASPTVTNLPVVGGEISLSGGKFANETSQTIQFYRCAHTCVLLDTGGSSKYMVRSADAGHYIELKLTIDGEAGSTPLLATDWIGPIRSANAGAATLTTSARSASVTMVKSNNDKPLAAVRVTRHSGRNLTLAITKPYGSARTEVWAFVTSGGNVVSCTESHVVRGTLRLNTTLAAGQKLKLVAVRS